MGKKILLPVILILTLGGPALASGFPDTYGFGVRAMALGNAFTAVADDFSAVHYNPAGLSQNTGHEVNINYIHTSPNLEVKRLNGADLYTTGPGGMIRSNPNVSTYDENGLSLPIPLIGAVLDVNRIATKLPVNCQFGIAVSMPEAFDSSFRIADYPPDQPHFIRYGDNIDRMVMTGALAMELIENHLHVGAGVHTLVQGPGAFYVEDLQNILSSTQDNALVQAEFGPQFMIAPRYGILATFWDEQIKIGLSYSGDVQLELGPVPILSTLDLGFGSTTVPMMLDMYSYYTPKEYRLGLAFDHEKVLISVDAALQKWSEREYSPTDKLNYVAYNTTVQSLIPEPGSPDFDDTINYSLGIEYKHNDDLSLMLGYSHVPTPVPDQSYRVSNYLDADKDCYSVGASFRFRTRFMVPPVKIVAMFQYQNFKDYTVYKDGVVGLSNWDGINKSAAQESYKVEGDVIAAGIGVNLAW